MTTDNVGRPGRTNDFTADAGLDAKYAVTQNLTADFTLNTDFAQVEADEQQVNLTQFAQFFPEKREAFLENSGMFYVGDAARLNRVSVPATPDASSGVRRVGTECGWQCRSRWSPDP